MLWWGERRGVGRVGRIRDTGNTLTQAHGLHFFDFSEGRVDTHSLSWGENGCPLFHYFRYFKYFLAKAGQMD